LKGYILINTASGRVWRVAEEALKISGVRMAHAVTGQYDVIVYVEFARMEDLAGIIDLIQSIDGVVRTYTAIVMAQRIS